MEEKSNYNKESLIARIQQLEHERDELHKDIEQLCMHQAGPGYLSVATRMHFQRTAGLEQEIENLKKKLAASIRENLDLQEELSEAYRVKRQLADLHSVELSKNLEAEKQVKFFQGCVAAAFAERDHSLMEAEKAKEKEMVMSQKLKDLETRVEELTSGLLEEKNFTTMLQIDLEKHENLNATSKKVIDKFYEIRQHSLKLFGDTSWEDKCESLLHDSAEMWSFHDGETSTPEYTSALEEELEMSRKSVVNLQRKLWVGLEIENHLKKKVCDLEKEKILLEDNIKKGISGLFRYHSMHRVHILNLLDEGYSHLKATIDAVEERIRQLDMGRGQNLKSPQEVTRLSESECRDVHVTTDAGADLITKGNVRSLPSAVGIGTGNCSSGSSGLAQALQEKVAALLLLSQEEERHLLERNVNAAIQRKMEELQRNLLQVTNEKVKALMELAELKQAYHLLQEKVSHNMKQGKDLTDIGEKIIVQDRDGKLKNMLKKTYLNRWIGAVYSEENEAEAHQNSQGNIANRRSNYNMDYARMKIENATLKESLGSMEHLISSVRRLRIALLKVKYEDTVTGMFEALEDILTEAKLVKTALGSSLPVSWSAEVDSIGERFDEQMVGAGRDSSREKVDFVSAAGFEMVELLMLAAQILKDYKTKGGLSKAD